MDYKFAEIEQVGPLALIEFKNPPHNVLGAEAVQELTGIYRMLEGKKSVEIIASIGMLNSFCTGADLKEIWELIEIADDEKSREAVTMFNLLSNTIAASSKITIVGVRGYCLGGGMELALAHRFRIAKNANFGFPEIGKGIMPGMGGTQRLPRLIGIKEAALMIYGGGERTYSDEHALRIGLIDKISEGDFFKKDLSEFAKKIYGKEIHPRSIVTYDPETPTVIERVKNEIRLSLAQKSPHAIRAIDKALSDGLAMPLEKGLELEQNMFLELIKTDEAKNAIGKFLGIEIKPKETIETPKKNGAPPNLVVIATPFDAEQTNLSKDATSEFCEREIAPKIRELLAIHATPPAPQKIASAKEDLRETYDAWRENVRKFCEKEIWPKIPQMEKEHKIFPEIIRGMVEIGMFGCCFPIEYGGEGLGKEAEIICMEELGKCFGSMPTFYGSSVGLALVTLDHAGNHDQKKRYLAPAIEGKRIGAFALSEEGAGSDPAAMKTFARLDGNTWILKGKKRFISTGKLADFLVTFAQTDSFGGNKTQVALIVDKNMPGVSITREHIDKVGLWASDTVDFEFDDVKIPIENQLGKVGDGFKIAMHTLNPGRIGLAAANLGMMKLVRKLSMQDAQKRIVSGKPLITSELYMQFIANVSSDIYFTECAVYDAIRRMDRGEDIRELAAVIKYRVPGMLGRNVDDAFRFFGGDPFSDITHHMAIAFRDWRIQDIYEGPKEINLLLIFKEVFKRFIALIK